jgi:hypothetical protein
MTINFKKVLSGLAAYKAHAERLARIINATGITEVNQLDELPGKLPLKLALPSKTPKNPDYIYTHNLVADLKVALEVEPAQEQTKTAIPLTEREVADADDAVIVTMTKGGAPYTPPVEDKSTDVGKRR